MTVLHSQVGGHSHPGRLAINSRSSISRRAAMINFVGFPASWHTRSASHYGNFPPTITGPSHGESFTIATTAVCSKERTALGSDHDESSLHERGWPWRFKQPGRLSTELPGEEAFTGFGGLEELLGDLDTDIDDSSDEHREVSREIRNACYCQVSIDRAPGAEVIVLSETGAMLTGIPPEAVSITTNGYQGQQMFTREGSSGASSIRWSTRKHKELAHYLTGTIISRGSQPLGCCYGGHQFGHWVGQLGDGRVATLGEIWAVCNRDDVADIISTWCGSLIEVQLKGIGKTPFSRGGDGKAVLDSCLLEYFFSQAFIGLGLGTAVAVAVCSTGENTVTRDEDPDSSGTLKRVPGAVLCRAAPSFLRFGSFELPARRSELNVVRGLADFCLRHLGPHLETDEFFVGSFPCLAKDPSPTARADELTEQHSISSFSAGQERERSLKPFLPKGEKGRAEESTGSCMGEAGTRNAYLELLVNVIQATARMVASWQALGFCHGVLNTDNFTLLGIAIDFGSCGKLENHRFMERYDPTWCPNKSDSGLRYTFQKQPDISAWNCERLAEAFSSLIGVSGIAEAKKAFSPAFDAAYSEHLQRKLGLTNMKLGSGWVDILKSVDADGRDTVGDVSSDARFVLELFRLMSCSGTDFTRTWRSLIDVPPLSEALHARVGSAECFAPIHSNDGASAWDGNPLESRNKNGGAVAEKSARECDKGVELSDDEVLRPVIYVLRASRVYREHRRHWACWIMEYMARIDSQGIGRLHHGGAEEGRRERFDTMRNSNPVFVLRASDLKQALNAVHAEDMMLVRRLDKKLSSPYASESVEEILPSCASQCNAGTGIP